VRAHASDGYDVLNVKLRSSVDKLLAMASGSVTMRPGGCRLLFDGFDWLSDALGASSGTDGVAAALDPAFSPLDVTFDPFAISLAPDQVGMVEISSSAAEESGTLGGGGSAIMSMSSVSQVVYDVGVNDATDDAQRSMVTRIQVTFNEIVTYDPQT